MQLSQKVTGKPKRTSGMVKGLILAGLLVLFCQALTVQGHVLSRHNSANSIGKIK
ncbi:natriuretic peptides A-like, partial [Clarias magur]